MPIQIICNDITRMRVDAIVNAANETLLGGGGVDGAIHRAAGPELLAECRTLNGCATGDAKITKGYGLHAKYVIHTVGPVWQGGGCGEKEKLISCYRRSLALARQYGCASVAFPLISAGVYGYPKAQAFRIAADTIRDFLMENDDADMLVYMVLFSRDTYRIGGDLYARIEDHIEDNFVPNVGKYHRDEMIGAKPLCPDEGMVELSECCAPSLAGDLEAAVRMIDESFSHMVLRLIDEKGMTDPECYKKANIDRKLFSKIRKDHGYRPSKSTALALAIALELDLDETRELLMKAGLALSRSDKFDIIVEYFIMNGRFDIFEINEALYSFDQPTLGIP